MPEVSCPGCRGDEDRIAQVILEAHLHHRPHEGALVRTKNWLRERVSNPDEGCRYRTVVSGDHRVVLCYHPGHHHDQARVQSILHPLSELRTLETTGHHLVTENSLHEDFGA